MTQTTARGTYFVVRDARANAGVPCRMLDFDGVGRCGCPVKFHVHEHDVDDDRQIRVQGACDDHADLYR